MEVHLCFSCYSPIPLWTKTFMDPRPTLGWGPTWSRISGSSKYPIRTRCWLSWEAICMSKFGNLFLQRVEVAEHWSDPLTPSSSYSYLIPTPFNGHSLFPTPLSHSPIGVLQLGCMTIMRSLIKMICLNFTSSEMTLCHKVLIFSCIFPLENFNSILVFRGCLFKLFHQLTEFFIWILHCIQWDPVSFSNTHTFHPHQQVIQNHFPTIFYL